jgi:hypothetical protein
MAEINKIGGANLDIDLASQSDVAWKQGKCPWNETESTDIHHCAVKYISICSYFCGIEPLDIVLCSYPDKIGHKKLR